MEQQVATSVMCIVIQLSTYVGDITLLIFAFICRWMKDLFRRGLKGPLEDEELYQHRKDLDSERVTEKFSVLWEDECKGKNPSIVRMIVKAYGSVFLPLGVVFSICESVTK